MADVMPTCPVCNKTIVLPEDGVWYYGCPCCFDNLWLTAEQWEIVRRGVATAVKKAVAEALTDQAYNLATAQQDHLVSLEALHAVDKADAVTAERERIEGIVDLHTAGPNPFLAGVGAEIIVAIRNDTGTKPAGGIPDICVISQDELDGLPEYSASLPTGTTIGKRWKAKRANGEWQIGEYVLDPRGDPEFAGIRWRDVVIEHPVVHGNTGTKAGEPRLDEHCGSDLDHAVGNET